MGILKFLKINVMMEIQLMEMDAHHLAQLNKIMIVIIQLNQPYVYLEQATKSQLFPLKKIKLLILYF